MLKRQNLIKTGLAAAFFLLLALCLLKNAPLERLRTLCDCLLRRPGATLSRLEDELADSLPGRGKLLDLNGTMSRLLNQRGYYSDLGIYVAGGDYLVTAYPETSTDYETQQVLALRDFLAENGIGLLYVCKPGKYLDDRLTYDRFGVPSFLNRNADRLLSRLRENGVPVVDLREAITAEGLEVRELFYRTDHHWTTEAALWALPHIARGLNEHCGYTLDPALWSPENFTHRAWENCWLGEQGQKLGATRVGLDDYTEILPAFETAYRFPEGERDFLGFVDEGRYDTTLSVYRAESWHYSYRMRRAENLRVPEGKILLLGDSYDCVTEPLLSLGVREIEGLILREYGPDFDLRQYILDSGCDTVVVCYAPLLLGAHDDVTSGNYNMYRFVE